MAFQLFVSTVIRLIAMIPESKIVAIIKIKKSQLKQLRQEPEGPAEILEQRDSRLRPGTPPP